MQSVPFLVFLITANVRLRRERVSWRWRKCTHKGAMGLNFRETSPLSVSCYLGRNSFLVHISGHKRHILCHISCMDGPLDKHTTHRIAIPQRNTCVLFIFGNKWTSWYASYPTQAAFPLRNTCVHFIFGYKWTSRLYHSRKPRDISVGGIVLFSLGKRHTSCHVSHATNVAYQRNLPVTNQ